jgi:putative membrane protein
MLTAALILVIIMLAAIFSVQNAVPVTISLFFWRFDASLAIVIFLSVLTGLITGVIVSLFLVPKKSSSKTTS